MSRIVRASLALLIVVGAALWGAGLHQPDGVEASGHSASRTFASPWVAPGGQLQVTITAQNYGAFGQVVETLPAGFRFVRSSLPASAVNAETDTVKFTLLGDESFTYTVEAPAAEGTYSFSGLLLDQAKVENQVGGDTSLRVGPAPTPASHTGPNAPTGAHSNRRAHASANRRAHASANRRAHASANRRAHASANRDAHTASDGDAHARARSGAHGGACARADGDARATADRNAHTSSAGLASENG